MKRIAPLFVLLGVIQADEPTAARPEFEVASIKPHTSDDRRTVIRPSPGGRFNATNVTLRLLMDVAYGVQDYQISGAPSWIDSDRYDIVAKADDHSKAKMPSRLQALLEDRFKLTIRRDTKEMPIYALVVAKGGPKLHEAQGECPPQPSGQTQATDKVLPCGSFRLGRNQLFGDRLLMAQIVELLSRTLARPLINRTGLTGKYDIKLEWTPDQSQSQFVAPDPEASRRPSADLSGPSIYTALQEQLGLKLESQKGPVEVLIIDHVEKPSEN